MPCISVDGVGLIDVRDGRTCEMNPCEVGISAFGDVPMVDQACCKRGLQSSGSSGQLAWPSCGDKSSSFRLPNPDPISDQECGEGYIYNPAKANRCCRVA